jgi:hypothetical protein
MESVLMRAVVCVPVTLAGMIGVMLAIASTPVMAVDCFTEPNREAPPGQHWYYHFDRGNDRKCWYLHATVTGASEAPGMELQSVRPQRRQAAPAPAAEPQQRQVAAPQRRAPMTDAEQATPPRRGPMTESDEAALYLEFLRWREQHRGAQ